MNGEQNIGISAIQSEAQSLERWDTRQEHEPGSTFFMPHVSYVYWTVHHCNS